MDEFLKEMADILDEESVNESDRLEDFAAWDSLAILSVISMADSRYNAIFSAQDIKGAATLRDLHELLSKGAGAAGAG